jgi:hypothetical protein
MEDWAAATSAAADLGRFARCPLLSVEPLSSPLTSLPTSSNELTDSAVFYNVCQSIALSPIEERETIKST